MVKVKICGITNLDDALLACELGADALGFIFYPESPRHISPEVAAGLANRLPPFITRVGVFVNQPAEQVRRILVGVPLDLVQLHGDESPDYCRDLGVPVLKVFRVDREFDVRRLQPYRVAGFLFDKLSSNGFGGTGETFNWEIALRAKAFGPVVLSGGLRPENVGRAVKLVRPYAVDTCSGVEAMPGKKDPAKLKAFFDAIACIHQERRER